MTALAGIGWAASSDRGGFDWLGGGRGGMGQGWMGGGPGNGPVRSLDQARDAAQDFADEEGLHASPDRPGCGTPSTA